MTVMIQFKFWRDVRKTILSPIRSEKVEVILVMLVIPFVVNTVMFWVVDNFTKRKTIRTESPESKGILTDSAFLMEGRSPKREKSRVNGGKKIISEEEIESLEKLLEDSSSTEIYLGDESSPTAQNSFGFSNNDVLTQRHSSSP